MPGELSVFLDGTPIGVATQSTGGAITFAYDEDYRRRRDATPLSLSIPLIRASHPNRPTRAFLHGLLPDSIGRLEELGREHRVSPNNPFALLTHVGRDTAGAVQLQARAVLGDHPFISRVVDSIAAYARSRGWS